jgi:hypothetical protein
MAERQEYVITMGTVTYTVLLDPADAKRYGDTAKLKAESKPSHKALVPQNK